MRSTWFISAVAILAGAAALNSAAWAQTEGIELIKTAARALPDDTNKTDVLNKLAFQYLEVDLDSAVAYAVEAETLSRRLDDYKQLSRALNIRGYVESDRGDFSAARELQEQSLDIAQKYDFKEGLSRAYSGLGNLSYNQSQYLEALSFFQKSLEVDRRLNSSVGQARNYNNIGNVYIELGQYEEALNYHFQSLRISEESKDEGGISGSYTNIGNIFAEQSKHNEALVYYQKSLELDERRGSKSGQGNGYLNIGTTYELLGRLDTSIIMYQKALEYFSEVGQKQGIAIALLSLGDANGKLGRYELALKYLDQSKEIAVASSDPSAQASALHSMARIFLAQKKYDEALRHASRSLAMVQGSGSRSRIKESRHTLFEIYDAQGRTTEALHWLKLYDILKDSLQTVEVTRKAAELQLIFEADRKDQKIQILQKDSTISRLELDRRQAWQYGLGALLIAALVISGVLAHGYRVKRDAEHQMQEKNAQLSKINEALEAALHNVKTLEGMLPICAGCKKVRDDGGYWNQIESYIQKHTDATFTHSLCPDCLDRLYPEFRKNPDAKKNHS